MPFEEARNDWWVNLDASLGCGGPLKRKLVEKDRGLLIIVYLLSLIYVPSSGANVEKLLGTPIPVRSTAGREAVNFAIEVRILDGELWLVGRVDECTCLLNKRG